MMSVTEKVAYLKGLAEGLGVDDATKEGKLLIAIIDALGDISENMDSLEAYASDLGEQVDAIDEDLDSLETDFYGDDEDDDDYYDMDGEDEYYDVVCPNCDEEFSVDEDTLLEGSIECPKCGEKLEFDIDECDDECCSCHCDEEDE
ncbi:MAG: hypothetical protein PHR24_00705 [Oscillospiraceae bacterium]|nr:hypothetical protein [Oscillospiraceae bacterium]MDD3832964.1 hypothetical protein [Oscillospiraceae bacterium]MDD4545797.1 hypothetical protein [Oscillospiraceae bacterium]